MLLLLQVWKKLEPYHPEAFLPGVFGLFLVFFGGQFPLIVAAIEAFRLTGWETTKASLITLWESYKLAKAASDKDDLIDDDKDGIPDVQQIGKRALATRKLQVFAKSTDPDKLQAGIQGLLGVVTTLKLQFAQSITLGVSLADIFEQASNSVIKPALVVVTPKEDQKWLDMTIRYFILESILKHFPSWRYCLLRSVIKPALVVVTPKEYQKWLDMTIRYFCRSFAVSVVWWLQRIMSAFHSAIRGAQMLVLGVVNTLKANGKSVPMDFDASHKLFPVLVTAIGVMGFFFQIKTGFELIFPFNFFAIPFRVLEWFLRYYITYN
eukprot:gene23163-30371_t